MKYVDELREPLAMRHQLDRLERAMTRPWTIMEICGGQTHTIARFGIDALIPPRLELVHGPGCPVCVTPLALLEHARHCALAPNTTLHTFGDMLRVPGVHGDLLDARAHGGDVHVILTPLDAVRAAQAEPDRTHVLFAVGFETTAPTTAMAIELAARLDLGNFAVLASHVRVPPAIEAILSDPEQRIDGFLAAGHVCTVEGFQRDYPGLTERFQVPIVVTGFEPVDILRGLLRCIEMLEGGEVRVDNAYPRAVRPEGNPLALATMQRVFRQVDFPFRGLGVLPHGGLAIRPELERFDAAHRLPFSASNLQEPPECRAALVLQGRLAPLECPELGKRCTPEHPLGAPMVSSEGACAAYYRYRRPHTERSA